MDAHEYAVVGHSRALIGRYIGIAAAIAASSITMLLVWLIHFGEVRLNLAVTIAIPPLGGGIFWIFHTWFDKKVWRWRWVRKLLGIPDIEGKWACKGTRHDAGGGLKEWESTITIWQTWERISINQRSKSGSESYSRAASLLRKAAGDFVLMYSYENSPDIDKQDELIAHIGYCELTFQGESQEAKGFYFNNKGRVTHGSMNLTKIDEGKTND